MNPSYKLVNEPEEVVPDPVTTIIPHGDGSVSVYAPTLGLRTKNIFEVLITVKKLNFPVQIFY
jgi:hypothetical protein